MVKDVVNNDYYRADKLLEDAIETKLKKDGHKLSDKDMSELRVTHSKAGSMNADELDIKLKELKVLSPAGGAISFPVPFNLMFNTSIGPTGNQKGLLRPETAQGIFVNFRRLLDYNGGRLPLSTAQIGLGFRNEISPRAGLLRVREFVMAEIEHFVDPLNKTHSKFKYVKDTTLPLLTQDRQINDLGPLTDMTLENAVSQKLIANETLAYFMARTYIFLLKNGISSEGLRFRQHLKTEMAHYACDCWDAEVHTSHGWIECAGHADRSAYDLCAHEIGSGVVLMAHRQLDQVKEVNTVTLIPDKAKMGPRFKKQVQSVLEALVRLDDAKKLEVDETLNKSGVYTLQLINNDTVEITRDILKLEVNTIRVSEEPYTPHVIEPSYGIGRILYAILEHTFRQREHAADNDTNKTEIRNYLSIPIHIAPIKCSILPISSNIKFDELINLLIESMAVEGISYVVDTSTASIGRRYARTDEIGVPFGITVDFESIEDKTVTLRERDSMNQIRLLASEAASVVHDMVRGKVTWEHISKKYPLFGASNK
eukprot:GHVR01059191.1.p1 GENE.GHVR01059191.1~~GHVR01059191.1.p1  ORF type:complete len:540 (+),score=118.51 GHVR01059191.1:539-2158(+)